MKNIRDKNLRASKKLGYEVNTNLPLLDEVQSIRNSSEIIDRLICLYAVIACSYGFPKEKALKWLGRENVLDKLSENEQSYLSSNTSMNENASKQWQVEGLWVLAWSLSCHDQLDFADACSDSFIQLLPDIAKDESTTEFRNKLKARNKTEIIENTDLSYCLHWAIREANIKGLSIPNAVDKNVIIERRKAFEWIVSQDGWDSISLDT